MNKKGFIFIRTAQIMIIICAIICSVLAAEQAIARPNSVLSKKNPKQKLEYQKHRFTPHITGEAITRAKGGFAI